MKKQLLIAAVAATMSVAATADISITGDAIVSFSSNDGGAPENSNQDYQRVRLKVVGSAGDTKVVAVIHNSGSTRVDKDSTAQKDLHMDSLYMTTKAGPVSIKAGDYWGTIGLGARSLGAAKKNAFSASTKVGGWKLGLFTANGSAADGSGTTNVSASGKIGSVTVGLTHNPDNFTDLIVKGKFGGVSVAAEQWKDKTDADNDTTLIHIGGKVNNFKWDVAQIKNDVADAGVSGFNSKLAPLGSMLIGKGVHGVTSTAIANVGNFSKILGVAVSAKLAGNTVKAIYTKNTYGANDKMTGVELIVSRPLGGATLTANIAKSSGLDNSDYNVINQGLRLDVKF